MNRPLLWTIIAIIVIAGGIALAMRGDSETSSLTPTTTSPTTTLPSAATAPATTSATGTPTASGSVKEFTVTGENFAFAPATMRVQKGDTVKVTFVNDAGTHDWVLDEFDAATKQLQAGQRETVTFVADKAGSFEYYCSVGSHRAMGMKGALIVE